MSTPQDQIQWIQGCLGLPEPHDGVWGPKTQAALNRLLAQSTFNGFAIEIDGEDIVVRNVIVTCFGGIADVESGADNGETESGKPTVIKNGDGSYSDTGLIGCALPVKADETATGLSPFATTPPIAWGTLVKFWSGPDEANPLTSLTCPLVDNGPAIKAYPGHAGDLTPAAAEFFAPGTNADKLAESFEMKLSYRILGGAKFLVQAPAPSST